ncbi:hypothetical protein DPMN_015835 [Dreissena polymorpha]|uniref:Uncharacterized protein n=1 Tax=Dreissena polymorpha TaxID=45954 RepID=A0A9D4NDE3_DREPO|nr:hypothetical protein DPMN_015835 [Dreissena polymorpha]
MNNDANGTLYEQAKTSLKKLRGEVVESASFAVAAIKVEPAFVTSSYSKRGGRGRVGRGYYRVYTIIHVEEIVKHSRRK